MEGVKDLLHFGYECRKFLNVERKEQHHLVGGSFIKFHYKMQTVVIPVLKMMKFKEQPRKVTVLSMHQRRNFLFEELIHLYEIQYINNDSSNVMQ